MSLREYVRDGPAAGGNSIPRRAIGVWLHWRTWASVVVVLLTMALAGWAAQQWGWVAAWFVGVMAAQLIDVVSEVGES